jgi:predicted nucleic acid-binding protein
VNVFVDSSALFAVLNAEDPNHKKAFEVWRRLLVNDTVLITTNYVLVETFVVAQRRFGMEAVQTFQDDIVPALTILWIDKGAHQAGVLSMLAAGSRTLSLVDCVSFHVMRQHGIKAAFAFDKHFEEQGFDCNP